MCEPIMIDLLWLANEKQTSRKNNNLPLSVPPMSMFVGKKIRFFSVERYKVSIV
jgi:hypothetical protein